MIDKKTNKPIYMVLIMLILVSFLFIKSGIIEEYASKEIIKTAYEFKTQNEKLEYEVLKIRTGVIKQYNGLDLYVANLFGLSEKLSRQIDDTKDNRLIILSEAITKKFIKIEEEVNRLKSSNGVLRNSLMYFSAMVEEQSEKNKQLNELLELTNISNLILKVIRDPKDNVFKSAGEYIKKKKEGSEKAQNSNLTLLLQHAEIIVSSSKIVNESIVKIVESDVIEKIDGLVATVTAEEHQIESSQKKYRILLFLFSIVMTVYVGFMIYRLKLASKRLRNTVLDMRYQKMATDQHAVICVVDEHNIIQEVNKNYLEFYGYKSKDVIKKKHENVHAYTDEENVGAVHHGYLKEVWKGVVGDLTKEKQQRWLELTVVPFISDEGNVYKKIYVGTDITDRKTAEEHIEYQAYHDYLTGLPNRRLLLDRLSQSLKLCKNNNHYGGLLYIDIDGFKRVNESLGHSVGDFLLIEISSRLVGIVSDCTVARLGGNEFVVLLPEVSGEIDYGKFVIQRIISKVQALLQEKFIWKDVELHITPSVGATLFPIETLDEPEIVKQAETALHRAKKEGKGQYRFYHPRMQETVQNRLHLESDLRKSFEEDQLYLNIQPQYDSDGVMIGAETLIRWQHPVRGSVSPAIFIPLAEETGLIVPVGRWVLEKVCALIYQWQQEYDGNMPFKHIAVNVSAIQFMQSDFVEMIKSIITKAKISAEYLELEITEGMLISDVETAIEKISELKKIGVRFSVDDFGTGYSSLMYLSKLPIEQLKIDQGFVRNITEDKYNAAIVETIIGMAKHLHMDVIAEGVETDLELNSLKVMGCHNFQGYYFSRPLEVEVFSQLLKTISLNKQSS